MVTAVLIDQGSLSFKTDAVEIDHLRYAIRRQERDLGNARARRPSVTQNADGSYSIAIGRLNSLVNTLAWYDNVIVRKNSTYQRKCHGSCAGAKSSVAECVCACGGLYHQRGIDGDIVLGNGREIKHVPVFMEWRVRKHSQFNPDSPDSVTSTDDTASQLGVTGFARSS